MKPQFLVFFLCFIIHKSQAQKGFEAFDNDLESFNSLILSKPLEAHFFLNKAIKKSKGINNDSLQAKILCSLGYYYYQVNNSTSAKKVFEQSIPISKKVKYYRMLGYAYNQLGLIAVDKGNYKLALSLHLAALKIANSYQIAKMKSNALNYIGNVFLIQKDTIKAMEYYIQNIYNAQQYNLDSQLTNGYLTVANLYIYSNPIKTKDFYKKALVLVKKNHDLKTEFVIEICYSNLYLREKTKQSLQKAFKNIQNAISIERKLQDESMLYYINMNLGDYYYLSNQYTLAEENYLKAETNFNKGIDMHIKLNLYNTLSELYEFKKEFEKSLDYKEKYQRLNDSLFSIEKNKTLNEIQTKYEVSNKNLKINLLTKDKKIQKRTIQFLSITGILLLLGAGSLYFFYRYRMKLQRIISNKENKIYKQDLLRLEQERELNKINGILDGQETERNRLAQEIHDGIGASLAGIKLELSQENAKLKNKNLDAIEHKMSSAFSELRSISHNLSLNFLEEKNLEFLLNELTSGYNNRNEFEITLFVFPVEDINSFSYTIKLHIYRIIQELLSNISKHAKANYVDLTITKHQGSLNIILEDDGIGYADQNQKGIGLKNINERLTLLGGTIKIESKNGTTIVIDVPLNE